MKSVVMITPPAVEPVTLFDLKTQLGLSPVEDQDHVKSDQLKTSLRRYIRTARVECENRTRRVFITQTWKMNMDRWHRIDPRRVEEDCETIKLPKQPFQSIVDLSYVDPTGATQTLVETGSSDTPPPYSYQLDPGSETQPARLRPALHTPWPPIQWIQNAISITFTCGYGDSGDTVPESITQAILFLAHSYYDSTAFKDVDELVNNMLKPYMNRVS